MFITQLRCVYLTFLCPKQFCLAYGSFYLFIFLSGNKGRLDLLHYCFESVYVIQFRLSV